MASKEEKLLAIDGMFVMIQSLHMADALDAAKLEACRKDKCYNNCDRSFALPSLKQKKVYNL